MAAHLAGELNVYCRDDQLLPKFIRALEKLAEVIRAEIPTTNIPECTLAHYEQLAAELRWRIENRPRWSPSPAPQDSGSHD